MTNQTIKGRMFRCMAITATAIAALGLSGIMDARADEATAKRILKSMSDYVASQKSLSVTFDADIEVITEELQKIQFTSSGSVLLNRPDKLRATRRGGYADVEITFDGKTMSLLGKVENAYLQADATGSVDQLIHRLRDQLSIAMPGADLLLSSAYDELMADVIDAKYIGHGVIDGVDCEHLAFRNADTDWQIWVELGARPIPRKYVITSKTMTAAPQYTLRIKEWRTDAPVDATAFTFKPPQGAKAVTAAELRHLDEVPPGIVPGARN
jgi:hypothetical protein